MKRFFCKSAVRLTALVCMLSLSGLAVAAEFSADLIQKEDDTVTKGKFFVKGSKMRMEVEDEAITIIDTAVGKCYVLDLEEKMYMEMPSTGPMPTEAEADKELAKIATKKHLGSEKINDYQCDKYLITYHDKSMGKMTQWYAKKLNYPIKIVYQGPAGEMVTEYRNIKEGGVSDSLFEIPPGYKKMRIPGMGPPSD